MRLRTFTYFTLIVIWAFVVSCHKQIYPISATATLYDITDTIKQDSIILWHIAPYRDSLKNIISKVIGEAAQDMPKGKPESLLGNFFCDALLQQSGLYFGKKADVCIMNYGGLRLPSISAGKITVGKIFELMPFDNFLVLIHIKGDQLLQLLNQLAKDGGWPVSGLSMKIKYDQATGVFIQGKPLQPDSYYTLVTSDYVAEGGDKMGILKNLPHENSGVMLRDALIGYIIAQDLAGKKIDAVIDGRIQYAE
jgi:2',3'-cyclic-nucleotide 2'-phosphodiesterase (5'-nucleotidase family)